MSERIRTEGTVVGGVIIANSSTPLLQSDEVAPTLSDITSGQDESNHQDLFPPPKLAWEMSDIGRRLQRQIITEGFGSV